MQSGSNFASNRWRIYIKDITASWRPIHWAVAVMTALLMWSLFGGLFAAMVWVFKSVGMLIGAVAGIIFGFALFFAALLFVVQWLFRQLRLG